jgi:hypothetical protein
MPTITTWIAPELFMTHNGVNVFRTYEDDDMDQGEMFYSFTLNCVEDGQVFDVRDLDVPEQALLAGQPPYITSSLPEDRKAELRLQWDAWIKEVEPAAIKAVIRAALDAGLVPMLDDMNDSLTTERE